MSPTVQDLQGLRQPRLSYRSHGCDDSYSDLSHSSVGLCAPHIGEIREDVVPCLRRGRAWVGAVAEDTSPIDGERRQA